MLNKKDVIEEIDYDDELDVVGKFVRKEKPTMKKNLQKK